MKINQTILSSAASVITASSRDNPADASLKKRFAADKPSPEGRRAVSHCVFVYYRWFGWLNRDTSPVRQIEQALAYDQDFQNKPDAFSDAELLPRAVPGWTRGHMDRPAAWVRSLQAQPRLWLRAKRGKAAELAEKLGDCKPGPAHIPEALEYVGEKDLFVTPEFTKGEFEIQDISSQAVSLICNPIEKQTWWDACAGEGGKTLHLSDLMRNTGLIWSSDRADWRLKNLKKRAARAGVFNYRAKLWDGSENLPTKTLFDGILIDAPCSGVGTWGRNPHARWTTTVDDVNELAQIQLQLLINAAVVLKVTGKLFYSVCTLTRRETTEVAAKFSKMFPQFRAQELKFSGAQKTEQGLTIWPQDLGGNGMFIAGWTRIA